MNQKYLLLTASYGGGHNAAKDGIKNYLEENGNDVLVLDIVDYFKYSKLSQKFYQIVSENIPFIWDLLFKLFNTKLINIFIKYLSVKFYSNKFNKLINEYNPDYVLASYPCYQYLLGNYVKKYGKRFNYGVVITDNFVCIPWYYDDKYIDKFFVIDSSTKKSLSSLVNHRKDDIITSFFPIEQKYFVDKSILKNKNIFILLSGFKEKFTFDLLENIRNKDFYNSITIIKGRNSKIYDKFKNKYLGFEKYVFKDFVNIKYELKNVDIFITKPGGAIISECISQDVFVISPFFIKGQEQGNIELLEKYNIGFFSRNIDKIINFLESGYLSVDTKNFKKLKNSCSVQCIINNIKT